jgi:hypothetical protein
MSSFDECVSKLSYAMSDTDAMQESDFPRAAPSGQSRAGASTMPETIVSATASNGCLRRRRRRPKSGPTRF